MANIKEEIEELSNMLKSSLDKINQSRPEVINQFKHDIKKANEHLEKTPNKAWKTYIHIIGKPRVMKSSYVIELYDNKELSHYLDLPEDSMNDHTACPCMIEPTASVSSIEIEKISLSNPNLLISNEIKGIDNFKKLYSLSNHSEKKGDYLLKIKLPLDECKFKYSLIEYPGISSAGQSNEKEKFLYKRMIDEMSLSFKKYPGFIITCFSQAKLDIPQEHPLSIFISEYEEILNTNRSNNLPLILSFNGVDMIKKSCSNTTDLLKILNESFQIHTKFNTTVQLINTKRKYNPIAFRENKDTNNIEKWIKQLSSYQSFDQLKAHLDNDGGLQYSRERLANYIERGDISNTIGSLFHQPWINKSNEILKELDEIKEEINKWGDISNIVEYIRKKVSFYSTEGHYQSIRELYRQSIENKKKPILENDQYEQFSHDIKEYWKSLIAMYYMQFIPTKEEIRFANPSVAENIINTEISEYIFNDIFLTYTERLSWSPELFFREKDEADEVLVNIMNFYLPNQILKSNKKVISAFVGI